MKTELLDGAGDPIVAPLWDFLITPGNHTDIDMVAVLKEDMEPLIDAPFLPVGPIVVAVWENLDKGNAWAKHAYGLN